MMTPDAIRSSIVIPALSRLGLYSPPAERLLLGTAAVESNFVNFIQFGGGPARGMFQMEPPTFRDIMDRVLAGARHATLRAAVLATAAHQPAGFPELLTNHLFAAAMARAKYFSVGPAIPDRLDDQAQYWWTNYNGRSPHGLKPEDYIAAWHRYCAPLYPSSDIA